MAREKEETYSFTESHLTAILNIDAHTIISHARTGGWPRKPWLITRSNRLFRTKAFHLARRMDRHSCNTMHYDELWRPLSNYVVNWNSAPHSEEMREGKNHVIYTFFFFSPKTNLQNQNHAQESVFIFWRYSVISLTFNIKNQWWNFRQSNRIKISQLLC